MRKILLVEDEAILRDTYEIILSTQPYVCHVAVNGLDALNKCKTQKYDLILLDLMMPTMNGVEFLEKFDDLESMKSKIIILSNLSDGKDLERTKEMGVLKNMVKSDFSPAELINVIKFDLEAQ